MMANGFKVGADASWNSEAGHVSGTIIKVHTKNVDYKGHTHHASADDPQYEIKSSKTEHIAMHKGQALTKNARLKDLWSESDDQANNGRSRQAQTRLRTRHRQ